MGRLRRRPRRHDPRHRGDPGGARPARRRRHPELHLLDAHRWLLCLYLAELAAMLPDRTGGAPAYAYYAFKDRLPRTYPHINGVTVWMYWLGWMPVMAVNMILTGSYLPALFGIELTRVLGEGDHPLRRQPTGDVLHDHRRRRPVGPAVVRLQPRDPVRDRRGDGAGVPVDDPPHDHRRRTVLHRRRHRAQHLAARTSPTGRRSSRDTRSTSSCSSPRSTRGTRSRWRRPPATSGSARTRNVTRRSR